jgi:hypothetical protein
MSRVLLLDLDHRQRIQFFRAREYDFRVQGGSDLRRSQKAKSYTPSAAARKKGIMSEDKIPDIDWDGDKDLIGVIPCMVEDKGRFPSRDDLFKNSRTKTSFRESWPKLSFHI